MFLSVSTVRELDLNLQLAVDAMRHCDQPVTAISSGCELFMRFITFAKLDTKVLTFENTTINLFYVKYSH